MSFLRSRRNYPTLKSAMPNPLDPLTMWPSFSGGGLDLHRKLLGEGPIHIEYIDTPAKVEISLSQHIGPLARPLVDVGEHVRSSQLIAQTREAPNTETDNEKRVSYHSRIHSPIDGIVTAIKKQTLPSGLKAEVIVIEYEKPLSLETGRNNGLECGLSNDTSESLVPQSGKPDWRGEGAKEILERIAAAGIVGLGGAMFPTDIKLQIPLDRHCDYLLLNAAECEPYLYSDAGLLQDKAFDVVGGIEVLAASLKPRHIVIGLEANKSYLHPILRKAIARYRSRLAAENRNLLPPLRIALLQSRYPQGAELQLVEALSGRRVPPGEFPLAVGCITVNVATCKAIYDAVECGLPLTRRIVTVSGAAVSLPKVFDTPVGTPLGELLQRCGGLVRPAVRMLSGGPMMGVSFYDLRQHVTKGSNGFVFLTEEEVSRKKERPCINCGDCIRACPMGLEPKNLYKSILAEDFSSAVRTGLLSCIECGACASVCPSQIALTQSFRMGKVRRDSIQG